MTLYEELTELAERATPGPYRFETDASHFDSAAVVAGDGSVAANYYRRDADAHLVVALMNALPDILAALEERDRLREALERIAQNYSETCFLAMKRPQTCGRAWMARAALEQPK